MSSISLKKLRSERESLSLSDPSYNPKAVVEEPTFEPTVVTDVSIREDIPNIEEKANKLTETGQFYDTLGNQRNADGSLVEEDTRNDEVDQLNDDAEDADEGINTILNNLYKQTDADSARQIKAIKAQYDVREQQLTEINRRNELATDTALLLGGSSRYTVSSNGLSSAQVKQGVMELAELDAMEQSVIAAVKQAQSEQNFRVAEKAIEQLEKKRQEKIKKATELAASIAAENNEIRKNMQRFDQEQAITKLFQQGNTDATDLQGLLKEQGYTVSISDISSLLKIIDPAENLAGLSTDYKTYKKLKEDGEIPENWNYLDFQAASANAKRKPSSSDGDDILPYSEWKNSDEAKKLLEEEMAKQGMSFTPETTDEFLKNVYDESVRELKRADADDDSNYTATSIPNDIKDDLLADIASGASIQDLYSAYPDVSTSYVSSLYSSLTKKKEEGDESEMTDEEFIATLKAGTQ